MFLLFSEHGATVMVAGKAKDLESRNRKIHPQLRCVSCIYTVSGLVKLPSGHQAAKHNNHTPITEYAITKLQCAQSCVRNQIRLISACPQALFPVYKTLCKNFCFVSGFDFYSVYIYTLCIHCSSTIMSISLFFQFGVGFAVQQVRSFNTLSTSFIPLDN